MFSDKPGIQNAFLKRDKWSGMSPDLRKVLSWGRYIGAAVRCVFSGALIREICDEITRQQASNEDKDAVLTELGQALGVKGHNVDHLLDEIERLKANQRPPDLSDSVEHGAGYVVVIRGLDSKVQAKAIAEEALQCGELQYRPADGALVAYPSQGVRIEIRSQLWPRSSQLRRCLDEIVVASGHLVDEYADAAKGSTYERDLLCAVVRLQRFAGVRSEI